MDSVGDLFKKTKDAELNEAQRHEINTAIMALDAAYRILSSKQGGNLEDAHEMYGLGLEKLRRLTGQNGV